MSDNIQEKERNLHWYVIQARTNAEKSVANAIREKIQKQELFDLFGEVLVPSEEIVEMKDGQKKKSERKFFPGYVLVQISTNLENGIPRIQSQAWHLIRETPKVVGFIGGTNEKPLPISDSEANRILSRVEKVASTPTHRNTLDKGQMVRVMEGPFNDFNGIVESVDYDRGQVKVSVLVFGRPTVVDFNLNQVEATE